jgi:hypothetical protein
MHGLDIVFTSGAMDKLMSDFWSPHKQGVYKPTRALQRSKIITVHSYENIYIENATLYRVSHNTWDSL